MFCSPVLQFYGFGFVFNCPASFYKRRRLRPKSHNSIRVSTLFVQKQPKLARAKHIEMKELRL
jgi:hypothetical protein